MKSLKELYEEVVNEETIAELIAKELPPGFKDFTRTNREFMDSFSKAIRKIFPNKSATYYRNLINDDDLIADTIAIYTEK